MYPPESGASQVCIALLQVTQKILAKDVFHWLEVITESLSFLWEQQPLSFLTFPKICKKIDKKTIFLGYAGPVKANYRLFLRLLTLHCFFLTLVTVFYMYNTIYPYLFLLFSHFMFLFSPSLSYTSRHETRSTIYNVSFNFVANCQ